MKTLYTYLTKIRINLISNVGFYTQAHIYRYLSAGEAGDLSPTGSRLGIRTTPLLRAPETRTLCMIRHKTGGGTWQVLFPPVELYWKVAISCAHACISSEGLEAWGSEVKPGTEARPKLKDHVMFVALFGSPLHIFNIKT